MTIRDVLLPLFVEVILTFVLLFWMASLRTEAISSGTRTANAFPNQLELSVLFYVLTILAWDTHHAGTIFVALAWLFVLLRLIQAIVHGTENNVRRRGLAFLLGAIVLAIMWGNYMMEMLVGI